ADGMYHFGFEIENGRFENEDGDANATLEDVADWMNYFFVDHSTTGTGLDRIVDVIKTDTGLAKNTNAGDINDGAKAADAFNHIILDQVAATNANADGWITAEDLRAMNANIRADADLLAEWTELHGDDEGDGTETGFHLVQNDGASTNYFGKNLVNTVADGIYHMGFEIQGDRFLNEDGDANATLSDVSTWLNFFLNESVIVNGDGNANAINGSDDKEQINASGGNDVVNAGGGNDLVYGGSGSDTIDGGAGNDLIYGGSSNDVLAGGAGDDVFRVTNSKAKCMEGYDTYNGGEGNDTIAAVGGAVDIGMKQFSAADSIETIDGTGATGPVRVLGDWNANSLDFSGTTLVGNVTINGGGGNDTITGSAGNDTIEGGGWGNQTIDGGAGDDTIYADKGNDVVSGGAGNDVFRVTGNKCSNFEGWDNYSGGEGTDSLVAFGARVDIGMTAFSLANGIETIDLSGLTDQGRLLGDWNANSLDFSGTTLVGHVVIDGGGGNDTIIGSAGAEVIRGGDSGNDILNGKAGNDLMYGGNGRDVFTFDQGWGRDTVADYRDNYDKLDMRGSGATGYGDLAVAQVGVDTVITIGADEIVLQGINANSINQSDFMFA
ncbi:MAG: hypothetical protein QG672_2455, partial [Pseudomonadota bacterium]|nr:hypothetical protein [Pseudomonadota bacterium]